MSYGVKLLTSFKNYLIHVVISNTRLDTIHNGQCHTNRHSTNGSIHRGFCYLLSQNMEVWGKNVLLEQKKIIFDNKNSKYAQLNQIFIPLVQNLVTIELPDDDGFTKLSFDKLNIQQNHHYPEVVEHMRKDLG